MSLRSQNIDWRKKFQWALEIDSPFGTINIAQIVTCDFPEAEIEASKIAQAGSLHDIHNPGRIKFSPITFERILLSGGADLSVHNWFFSAADPENGTGLAPSKVKKNIDLLHLDDGGNAIERIKIFGAWVSKIVGDKQEGSSDPWLEKITLTYDRYKRTTP